MVLVMALETIFIVLVLITEVPSGAIADFIGRKNAMALALLSASIGFMVFGLGNNLWHFLIAQIIFSFSWAMSSGSDSAMLYDSLKEEKLTKDYLKILGKGNFLSLITFGISSILSIILVNYFTYRELFFLTSGIYFIGAVVSLTITEPPIHKHLKNKAYLKHLKEAFRFSYKHTKVRNLIIYYGLFAALGHLSWFLIQPLFAIGNKPTMTIGLANFLFFITAGIGSVAGNKALRIFKQSLLQVILLLITSASFIAIYFSNKVFAIISLSIISFASGIRDVVVDKGINDFTASHHRATVLSIQSMSKSLMYAIFSPLIGYATDVFSAGAAFFMMGLGLFLFMVFYVLINRKLA